MTKQIKSLNSIFIEQVNATSIIERGDKILLAVSGGPDSTTLIYLLNSLKEEFGLKLAIFHQDHAIRKNSKKDTEFVKKIALSLNIDFYSSRDDIKKLSIDKKISIQLAARQKRYDNLAKLAKKIKANKIATAHTADDQVETFFLRFLRGASLNGLKSIPSIRNNIIRPLLRIEKAQLIKYLDENKISYLNDPSNIKPIYLRNRIRNELIPIIKNINPNYLDVVQKNINIINEEELILDLKSQKLANELIKINNKIAEISIVDFSSLSKTFQRRLVRNAILLIKGDLKDIEYKHIDLVLSNAAKLGFTVELPKNLVIYIDYKKILIGSKLSFSQKPIKPKSLKLSQSLALKELGLNISATTQPKKKRSNLVACLDYDKIKFPLKVRSRQQGDRFYPLGAKGSKKLQDFFVDKKVAKFNRDSIIVVEDKNNIIWIAGYQIDERVKIDKSTKTILQLEVW